MVWPSVVLLAVQCVLLITFSFFAFFNYLYGVASFWKPRIRRTTPSGKQVAVVIVSFNEEFVLEDTIRACDGLSYPHRVTVLADDSTDPVIVQRLRRLAKARGCNRVLDHPFSQEIADRFGNRTYEPIEIWESPDFVLLHRPTNAGFKAGSLRVVHEYLERRGLGLMYLLDADWHPQPDTLERTLEVLEADERIAFVQTKRVAFERGMRRFQKYVALVEEGCYYVDFEGRQVLGHPILFSGCCALFRLDAIAEVGGFTPGHLTEDLDLSNRFWGAGWKGVYLSDVVNYGEVPFTYDHFRRQQERWAAGTARALKDHIVSILRSGELGWLEKLAIVRQNAYYVTTFLTGFAILLGLATVLWLAIAWNTYPVEAYLYSLDQIRLPFLALLYGCILSNFVEPLVMIVWKKRTYRDLMHFPMMVWYAWSVLPTYAIGNVKGLFDIHLNWFRTPKFHRHEASGLVTLPRSVRTLNLFVCIALLFFYFSQGWVFGWFDEFALILIPAFILASKG